MCSYKAKCGRCIRWVGGFSGLLVGADKALAADFAGGSGTESDPYQIATAGQLDAVRYHLEAGVYFKLTAEIDLSGYSNWQPIGHVDPDYGNSDYYFKGNIDGNGFKIKNLKINETYKDTVGLFGVAYYSVLNNMALENVNVTGSELASRQSASRAAMQPGTAP